MDQKTVLIVEDEAPARDTLREFLEPLGLNILTEEDVAGARSTMAMRHVDLIFCDINMPGELGTDFCRSLKQNPSTSKIPLVLLTALDGEDAWRQGFEVGADLYAVKPFSRDRILMITRSLLGKEA